jgi:hypothetical protein
MAILFKAKPSVPPPKRDRGTGDDAFGRWYDKNKPVFNLSRRERYKTDPEYKKRVLDAARKARDERRKQNPKPEAYTTTLQGAADALDITIWTLRNWRTNEYFPEPLKFNGELWFTDAQVKLLTRIKDYLDKRNIKRLSVAQAEELYGIVKQIRAYWG